MEGRRVIEVPAGLVLDAELSQRAKNCYVALAANGWQIDVSTGRVAELMGVSWLTAQRALHDLQEGGWITSHHTQTRERES